MEQQRHQNPQKLSEQDKLLKELISNLILEAVPASAFSGPNNVLSSFVDKAIIQPFANIFTGLRKELVVHAKTSVLISLNMLKSLWPWAKINYSGIFEAQDSALSQIRSQYTDQVRMGNWDVFKHNWVFAAFALQPFSFPILAIANVQSEKRIDLLKMLGKYFQDNLGTKAGKVENWLGKQIKRAESETGIGGNAIKISTPAPAITPAAQVASTAAAAATAAPAPKAESLIREAPNPVDKNQPDEEINITNEQLTAALEELPEAQIILQQLANPKSQIIKLLETFKKFLIAFLYPPKKFTDFEEYINYIKRVHLILAKLNKLNIQDWIRTLDKQLVQWKKIKEQVAEEINSDAVENGKTDSSKQALLAYNKVINKSIFEGVETIRLSYLKMLQKSRQDLLEQELLGSPITDSHMIVRLLDDIIKEINKKVIPPLALAENGDDNTQQEPTEQPMEPTPPNK